MKSLFSVCLVAGSALIAGSTITESPIKKIPDNASILSCAVNGKVFTATSNDSSLTTTFTYADNKGLTPAALFLNAATKAGNRSSQLYMQPLDDDAPSERLIANCNLYNKFYITYKAADNTFYHTTTAPGNLEISCIDTVHKTITGRLNCILYSSTTKDWLLISNGRFSLRY